LYLPLSNKFSLHKNKRKRALNKRQHIEEDEDMLRPVKISERLPDTYVLASRGYSLNEIDDANKAFKQMQCQIEIS
jgi:hypothetical protein